MSPASPPVTCNDFDTDVAELALDLLTDPRRRALLEHAVACRRCQARLDGFVAIGDQLVLLAPPVDPPAGFETRALSRIGGPVGQPRRATRSRVLAGIAALAAALAVGVLVGRVATSGSVSPGRAAAIRNAAGDEVGNVRLVAAPTPHILVSVARPPTTAGLRTCELERPDGSWVVVGTWTREELSTGVWAVAVDPALLHAQAMRVTNDDGAVLASAQFNR
jgi:hypothetical protein